MTTIRTILALCALCVALPALAQQDARGGESPSQQAAVNAAAHQRAAVASQQSGGWVAAGSDATNQPNSGEGTPQRQFPSPRVIAPPAKGFSAANNGPSDYGAPSGQDEGQRQAAPSSPAQAGAIPPPPVIQQALRVTSPFTPHEIRTIHRDFDATRRAAAENPVSVIPRVSAVSVDLAPGAAPPVVRTARGQPSTVVFFDSTGAPWPLAAAPQVAGGQYFQVRWLKGTSALVITATSSYRSGGMAVFLKGLATPIVVRLSSGEPESTAKVQYVDYRLDLRVPGRGPNAKAPLLGPGRIGMYDDVLQAFLDGVPPSGASPVSIDGNAPARTKVWKLGQSLYLRTPLEIRSAFDKTASSADGMHVYKLAPTPLVTVSEGGQDVSLTLNLE